MAIQDFLFNVLLLNLIQNACSVPVGGRSSRNNWVFWYYANDDGPRSCGNYCVITFSLVGGIILILILCGCLSCYRIRKRSKEEGRRPSYYKEFFHSQHSLGRKHGKSNTGESMSDVMGQ